MKFLSVFSQTEVNAPCSPEEMERMGKLVEEGMKAGYLLDVQGCMPSSLGARVRRAGDKFTVTNGPFAESELIGGLAIIQAESKEEAIQHVLQFLHTAGDGVCELRQLFTVEDCPCGMEGQAERSDEERQVAV
ncbi:MAG: transcriptional regulator [Bryobacterales bacterium]|nr:transcriptional regulator [Bryobacterales bacterium]